MNSQVVLVLLMFVGACSAPQRLGHNCHGTCPSVDTESHGVHFNLRSSLEERSSRRIHHVNRTPGRCSSNMRNMEEKVNDLWGQLLFPVNHKSGALYAVCNVRPNPTFPPSSISGSISFRQLSPSKQLEMMMDIQGFPGNGGPHLHGIHVHSYADLKDGCEGAGPHFNPFNVSHPHHPGDFGNFHHDATGHMVKPLRRLPKGTLFGPESFIGRSIVIHEGEDDLGSGGNPGSLLHGNSGRRLACCVIGISATLSS